MPNPKWRHSTSRRDKRRTHDKMTIPQVGTCSNCGTAVLWHRVCNSCGYYRGKRVMEVKNKVEK